MDMKRNVFALFTAVMMSFVLAVALCLRVLSAPQTVFSQADNSMKIVLDAGHGGVDGGVVGVRSGEKESDINLSITLKLKDELESMGFAVVLTRKTQAGLYGTATKGFKRRDMQKRKEIIEAEEPALVISIHQNFYPSQTLRGAQVFYAKDGEKGKALAGAIQEKLNGLYQGEGVKSRNIAAGDYYMLNCTTFPSVIVECGFLSSPADDMLLTSNAWQKRIAEKIAAGALAYLSGAAT